jgi:CelD/BcsL family acetyltransferase involved in cellulose biosynthesis
MSAATEASPVVQSRPSTRGDGPLTIESRSDVNWSAHDRAALETLMQERPHVSAFLSPAWLSGLCAAPPHGFDPVVLVFRQDGVLRGLVPLAIRTTFTGTHVGLLGGGYRSDRVDLLSTRGYEPALSDMLLEWLDNAFGRSGYVLQLRDVPTDSALWGAIRRAVEEKRRPFVLAPREVHTVPYLPFDEQHVGSPRERADKAASIARHRRMLEQRGCTRIEILHEEHAVLEALETLARLLHARWGQGRSVLDNAQALAFHRHVVPRLLAEGRLRMLQISVDRHPVAVCYLLAVGSDERRGGPGKWFGYFLAGYDRQWAGRIHLGRLTVVAGMEAAMREGAREFDFLKGCERSKYYWPVRERTTIDADVYSGTSRTLVSRARHEGRQMAASLLKSAWNLFPSSSR